MPSRAPLPAAVRLLTGFQRAMRRGKWRWYVFGAQAVAVYGRPRMTGDVDVTVDLGRDDWSDLVRELHDSGFRARFPIAEDFAGHFLPMLHEPTEMPIDVVLARPGLHGEFLSHRRRVDIGGVTVPLISVGTW